MTEQLPRANLARAFVPVSRELLDEARSLTPPLTTALRGDIRRPEPSTVQGCDQPPDLWLRLMAARPNEFAIAVLNLHHPVATYPWWHWVDGVPFKPRIWECAGCEFEGYEAEPPDWPCETVALVAQFAGVPL